MRLSMLLILSFLGLYLSAQSTSNTDSSSGTNNDLLFYADIMINGFEASTRERAALEFEKLFDTYLTDNLSLSKSAEFLKYISIQEAPDNKFKLITWLIDRGSGVVDYRGYLAYQDSYTKLNRGSQIDDSTPYNTSSIDDWYGCVYYNIMKNGNDSYLLFGYDTNGKYDNTKILDVLTIKDGNITFGAPIFEDKESLETFVNRIVLSYSSDASVNLNFNKGLNLIIHDHLQARMGQQAGQGPTNIPDGTYEGYVEKRGKWYYKEKLFDHVYDEAPRPKPVFIEAEEK